MKCTECGRRVKRGPGRPRSTCSKACARARAARRHRESRASKKVGASNNPAEVGYLRELRHWALTGEWDGKPAYRDRAPAEQQAYLRELAEVWAVHTCKVCRNGRLR